MDVPNPEPITLTPQEQALLQKINFGFANPGQPDTDPKGDAALELTRLLCARGAIPDIRRRYLTDPKLNIGGRGKSRVQVFGSTRGEVIFRDGNFLPYLKYFIFGPDLPSETIARLRQVVEDGHRTGGNAAILPRNCCCKGHILGEIGGIWRRSQGCSRTGLADLLANRVRLTAGKVRVAGIHCRD